MTYKEYKVSYPLSDYVSAIWILHDENPGVKNYERIIPYGAFELAFHLKSQYIRLVDNKEVKQPHIFYAGQFVDPIYIKPSGSVKMIGVSFFPWAGGFFNNIPANELTSSITDVKLVDNKFPLEMLDILSEQKSDEKIINKVQIQLLKQLNYYKEDKIITHIAKQIILAQNPINIQTLITPWGFSRRRFEQRFLENVGLNATTFAKKMRFHNTFRYLSKYPENSLTEIAHASGYSDQSHFIRQFKEFSGLTPGQYIKEKHNIADLVTDENNTTYTYSKHARE